MNYFWEKNVSDGEKSRGQRPDLLVNDAASTSLHEMRGSFSLPR